MTTAEANHHQRNGHARDPYAGATIEADHAERSLCACLMLAPEIVPNVTPLVSRDDFRVNYCGQVFGAIARIAEAGDVADVSMLVEELSPIDPPDSGGWLGYLLELTEIQPHAANAHRFAVSVRDAAQRRRVRSELLNGVSAIEAGGDASEIVAEVAGRLESIHEANGKPSRFEIIDAKSFAASDYSVDYLIDDVLVTGQPCILGGPQKALKTSLVVSLFMSLAIGAPFLGKFKVNRRCRTLLLSGESGLGTLQETSARISFAMGVNLAHVEGWHICSTIPQLSSDEDMAELGRLLRKHSIDAVAVDPLYLAMPSDDVANLFAQGELLGRVTALCQPLGVTPILLHHTNRSVSRSYEPAELTDLAFAGFPEFARQWLLVNRREKYECGGKHALWLTIGGSAGHSGLFALDIEEGRRSDPGGRYWEAAVRLPEEVRKDDRQQEVEAKALRKKEKAIAELEQDKKEVVRHLVKLKAADTYRGIRTNTGLSDAALKRVIAALLDGDTITEATVIKNGAEYEGFTIKPEGNSGV